MSAWQPIKTSTSSVYEALVADDTGVIGLGLRINGRWFLRIEAGNWPGLYIDLNVEVFPTLWLEIPPLPDLPEPPK